ncbi:MAG: winged helix-turn-helix transcriptional regulator [Candidatus Bathyarchaeota archaeon]|nr:MAG: winged helix-turn-helix transcriptional regulator [Candidatus Bathyarchaeota archaeon]
MHVNGDLGADVEELVLRALSHRERRNILKIIESSEDGVVYSGILGDTGLSTGRLNYHLKELEGFIERNEQRKYRLTALGKKAVRLMNNIREDVEESYEDYTTAARANRKAFIQRHLNRAFYVGAVLFLLCPLATTYFLWNNVELWWIVGTAWLFCLLLIYFMDRVRKKSPRYLMGFIDWLEWRMYGEGSNSRLTSMFPGSRLVVGLLIGAALGAILGKVGAGILLGLFLGTAMEI